MNAAAAAVVVLNGRQAFDPRATLFAHNEPGAWYDASDLGTMFTDSAGTTPVTAVEQAVGLILDKSRGLAVGGELVTNGDFGNGTTGWGQFAGTIAVSGGEVTLTANAGAAFPQITQTISGLTAGRMYVMTGTARRGTSADPVFISPVSGTSVQTTATTATALRVVFTATGATSNIGLGIFSASANGTAIFDNISVREIAGTHAIQATAASRPVLRNRYNQLTYSEQFDNAAWTKNGATVTANTTTAPDGTATADSLIESAGSGPHGISLGTLLSANTPVSFAFRVKQIGNRNVRTTLYTGGSGLRAIFDLSTLTATNGSYGSASFLAASVTALDNNWFLIQLSGTVSPTEANPVIGIEALSGTSVFYTGDGTSGIYLWGADLRSANDTIYPYQRIEAATVYDSDASKFPLYLACDGSDDSLYTAANLDLSSTDKVTVFAGVTKLSDAAAGIVVELSADINGVNGAFYAAAPETTGASGDFSFRSKGTGAANPAYSGTVLAPAMRVFTGIGNISGDSTILRLDGVQVGTSLDDQGTGNYGSYPLYIGRRNNASLPFNGRIYQLIVRGAASSAAEIASTERYIAGKQLMAL
jgi:hypothetical protein